jgi:hypothetical protein
MAERKRVLIATPRWGVDPPECADSQRVLSFLLGKWEAEPDCPYTFDFGSVPDMLVQLARELCARETLAHNFDYLCMIDDDMLIPTESQADGVFGGVYINIWKRLLAWDVDIVAPLAFMRNPPHYPVCFARVGGVNPLTQNEQFRPVNILNYPKNTLFECDYVGFGAVCIKAEVLRGVGKPWFMSTNPTGEDILFCEKARKKGFRVFMDTTFCLKHLGPRQYIDESYYERTDKQVADLRKYQGDWTPEKARQNLAS